jgi:NAD(P)-dependent dehydrogenase (short-subunit alcohol dehydrogenase family)
MSNSEPTQRIVITGSSSGFGLLTVKSLLTLGYEVVATMRDSTTRNASKAAELRAFSADTSGELTVVELDVTSDTSVASAAEEIRELGRVDVLVNNAGVMNIGITEAYSIDEVQAQFEVNTFGPARVAKAFIPQMREQKSGLIINLSSVLGRLNLPFFGVYCASKFALEALFEAYRYELAAFGVDCIIVEPGPYGSASALLANSPAPKDQSLIDAYGELAAIPGAMKANFQQIYDGPNPPRSEDVSDAIVRLIQQKGRRPLRTVVAAEGMDFGAERLNHEVGEIQNAVLTSMQLGDMI